MLGCLYSFFDNWLEAVSFVSFLDLLFYFGCRSPFGLFYFISIVLN